ncbi:LytTR family DNA-binding domain-containing protein [Chitinophaga niabensis]|uniref:LytR/AlgR family response regulator transcription factor n=1 Tax=Chitinophaga niabensis TaxID=536979 RepID=UPI0031B9F215
MIRCMIVDDEPIAHQILEQYILQTEGLTLVAKSRNAMEAFAKLEQQEIDLLFLDIEMPLVKGTTFLKTLSHPPKVIFTTAYAEHAVEGFELNAVDYLLKPFSYERFAKAVAKLKPVVEKAAPETTYLVIKEKDALMKIAHTDILYIEAAKDYMKVHTADRQYLVHQTMKNLESALPAGQFIRTHKSYIVALAQIKLVKTDSLLLANQVSIPVSPNYKEAVVGSFKRK